VAVTRRGLLVGRFQPFHRGHLGVVEAIRKAHPEEPLLLGIGSAQVSYTRENPFTAAERMEMAHLAIAEAHLTDVHPVPLLDIDRHALWVSYLTSLLPPFQRVYTRNPLTEALFRAQGYEVIPVEWVDRTTLEGARIRAAMAAGGRWAHLVPDSVARYLGEIDGVGRLRMLLQAPLTPPASAIP
jgi:nicotinamide-nucleotide adenylyltransferase